MWLQSSFIDQMAVALESVLCVAVKLEFSNYVLRLTC